MNEIDTFERLESAARSYCRDIPMVFRSAKDHLLTDENGREYIDFLSGAGALNYGHNNKKLIDGVVSYLKQNGIIQSLDLHTTAKREFLDKLESFILKPRGMDYRVQFTGPSGASAVEAALKLARCLTGRKDIVAFTSSFHGVSLGALAVTATAHNRSRSGVTLAQVVRMPFDGYFGANIDTMDYIEKMIDSPDSGIDLPAAFILETVQAEGGVNIASKTWLKRLAEFAHKRKILLIVDDIQAGCGRTGSFFSFEEAQIEPDLVCLSKSIGGIGLPLSLLLIRPEYDVWRPGEHNGTFRGNNLAFIAGGGALDFWQSPDFELGIRERGLFMSTMLQNTVDLFPNRLSMRGRGMIFGLQVDDGTSAKEIASLALDKGLIVETCGPNGSVIKLLPPLNVDVESLERGLKMLCSAAVDVLSGIRGLPSHKSKC